MKLIKFNLGNYVIHNERIHAININDLTRINILPELLGSEFNPIPLTPEILNKIGYSKFQMGNYKSRRYDHEDLYPFVISNTKNGFYLSIHSTTITAIRYLHELQNFFLLVRDYELKLD